MLRPGWFGWLLELHLRLQVLLWVDSSEKVPSWQEEILKQVTESTDCILDPKEKKLHIQSPGKLDKQGFFPPDKALIVVDPDIGRWNQVPKQLGGFIADEVEAKTTGEETVFVNSYITG